MASPNAAARRPARGRALFSDHGIGTLDGWIMAMRAQ
ncbi:hypothetical protein RLIN73S_01938 [Rhodanobacter lindaniclasticus]